MTTSASTHLVLDAATGLTGTETLKRIRDRLRAVTSSQLVRPGSFGAVANSVAAAAANRAALQAWLDAAKSGGVLFHNPADVYYVQARPTAGSNAAEPLTIRYPSHIPFLRLRSKYSTPGPEQRLVRFGLRESTTVFALQDRAIARGQYLWYVADPAAGLPPIGAAVLLRAGQDEFTPARNALMLRARVVSVNADTGAVLLDRPAPRACPASTSAPAPSLTIVSSAADGSYVGLLEVDQSEHGNTALDVGVEIGAVVGAKIECLRERSATGNVLRFGPGAQRNHISELDAAVYSGQAVEGSCGIVSDGAALNNIGSASLTVTKPGDVVQQRGYAERTGIRQLTINLPTLDGLWQDFNYALLKAVHAAEGVTVGTLRIVAAKDAGDGDRLGYVVATSLDRATEARVQQLVSNKDWHRLGCRPGHVDTKTVCGARTIKAREFTAPARSGAGSTQTDFWLGSLVVDKLDYSYSGDITADSGNNYGLFIFSGTYNSAGGNTDSLWHRYDAFSTPENRYSVPPGSWIAWLDPLRDTTGVGETRSFDSSSASRDRFIRLFQPAVAGARTVRLQIEGYPVRNLFTKDDT